MKLVVEYNLLKYADKNEKSQPLAMFKYNFSVYR